VELGARERALLDGAEGSVVQRILRTLVLYGDAVRAERLVPVEGAGHFSISAPLPGTAVPLPMLRELVDAGLRTPWPFTLDPHPPLDFEDLGVSDDERAEFERMFADAAAYHAGMVALGLRDPDGYTCAPYTYAGGNVPERGQVLAWSESSCVIYANSVIGARTNRNAAILDLMSNLVGLTPLFGLLTDAGRRATWDVRVETGRLPHPQLLGAVVGRAVGDGVPWIGGLAGELGDLRAPAARDYLKEVGAAAAAIGAVGLMHVEGITPEARDAGRSLLVPGARELVVDDAAIEAERSRHPATWATADGPPERCLIGCPHLSLRELRWWADHIDAALARSGRERLAVETIMIAAPHVIRAAGDDETARRLREAGVRLSGSCAEDFLANPLCGSQRVATNSSKLSTFTRARMFPDEELVDILVTGSVPA
jgi:predicted aconitase